MDDSDRNMRSSKFSKENIFSLVNIMSAQPAFPCGYCVGDTSAQCIQVLEEVLNFVLEEDPCTVIVSIEEEIETYDIKWNIAFHFCGSRFEDLFLSSHYEDINPDCLQDTINKIPFLRDAPLKIFYGSSRDDVKIVLKELVVSAPCQHCPECVVSSVQPYS